jgi:hypothetical protein
MNKNYYKLLVIVFFVLIESTAFCQTTVQPAVLSKSEWSAYFTKYFHLQSCEAIKTEVTTNNIPFPSVWKYAADNKIVANKYRLYSFGNADYMTVPSNNGIGTYLFFLDHKQPEKDFIEMNFVADSIACQQFAKGIILFKLTDTEFKIPGDSSNLNRYIFTDKNGRIAPKAIVAHGCSISFNSTDTVHSTIYFNVQYPNNLTCIKCLRFDYKNNLLLSDISNIAGRRGTLLVDDVHWCALKKIEGVVN